MSHLLCDMANVCKQTTFPTVGEVGTQKSKVGETISIQAANTTE